MDDLNPTCLVTYHYVFYTAMVNCFSPSEKRHCHIFLTEQDNDRNRIELIFQKINNSYGTPFLCDKSLAGTVRAAGSNVTKDFGAILLDKEI